MPEVSPLTNLFNLKTLLSAYFMPGIVVGTRYTGMSKTNMDPKSSLVGRNRLN